MGIALVPYVKDQAIPGRVKHPMDGYCQLHHAQIGRQMSAGLGHAPDEKRPQLPTELLHLLVIQFFYIFRISDLF